MRQEADSRDGGQYCMRNAQPACQHASAAGNIPQWSI